MNIFKNMKSIAIHFEDLKTGDCIVSPTERTVCGSKFDAGRMLQVEGGSSHLDGGGKPLVKILMGRAGDRVRGSDVVIDSGHLPKWQQVILPASFQTRILLGRLFNGAVPPSEEELR